MNSANTINQRNRNHFPQRYKAALWRHLKPGRRIVSSSAARLGHEALSLEIGTLDVARIHEQALAALLPDSGSAIGERTVRRAGAFFAEIVTPIENTHPTARESNARLMDVIQTLSRRSLELAATNRLLKQEMLHRESAEKSLKRSEQHYGELLAQSRRMQEQLRLLSRQLLLAQEEERKKISRELHDVIAQTLTRINVQLATLKKEAAVDARGVERNIARTQKLVEESVNVVHRFARELRPTVLDDLGLIPALHAFMKTFRAETGIRVSLSVFAEVERVNGDKRTVLYRVAQEALANVARHARASRAQVRIQQRDGAVCMSIRDNGQGFRKVPASQPGKSTRLGLLGMRERLEMVGGRLNVTSAPGRGTTVLAQIPLNPAPSSGGGKRELTAVFDPMI